MKLQDYLKKANLSEKEIKVYLACLELGESRILPISERTGIPRTTTYHILERLKKKKLIEIIQTTSRRIYAPYPPRNIIKLLKKRRFNLDTQIDAITNSLPELNRLYRLSPFQPKIRYFAGLEIRSIYNEILEAPIEEEWYVGEANKIVDALGKKFLEKWIKKRVVKGIRAKAIRVESEEVNEPLFESSNKFLRLIKYAPPDFNSPTHILIYGDNVGIITTGEENFGVVITSREYAETMRNWFRQLWKVSRIKKP